MTFAAKQTTNVMNLQACIIFLQNSHQAPAFACGIPEVLGPCLPLARPSGPASAAGWGVFRVGSRTGQNLPDPQERRSTMAGPTSTEETR